MKTTLDQQREIERQKYLQLQPRGYGGTNHGRRAITTVLLWQPRFVVDFGCGNNAFVAEVRRRGVDGLGVDFANPEADLLAPMHAVPLASGIAEVITPFDAMEHLLPEDVDPVLAEMKRVATSGGGGGGRFVFSICTRPSRITVEGQNLHPTVQPLDWWLERIGRVGQVDSVPTPSNPYIAGTFHA